MELPKLVQERINAYDRTRCNVIDNVTSNNIYSYEQGSFDLITADVVQVFPPELADKIIELFKRHGVEQAFHARRLLINFKKVLYHLFQQTVEQELRLRQLASVLFAKYSNNPDDVSRYEEISFTLATCKGCLQALQETRRFCREICKTHRHPQGTSGKHVSNLPKSMMVSKCLQSQINQLTRLVDRKCADPSLDEANQQTKKGTQAIELHPLGNEWQQQHNEHGIQAISDIHQSGTAMKKPRKDKESFESDFENITLKLKAVLIRYSTFVGGQPSTLTPQSSIGDIESDHSRTLDWEKTWKAIASDLNPLLEDKCGTFWLEKLLIGRGAAKCFIMKSELKTYCHYANILNAELCKSTDVLQVPMEDLVPGTQPTAQRILLARARCLVGACSSVYSLICRAMSEILRDFDAAGDARNTTYSFVASDIGIHKAPPAFTVQADLDRIQSVIVKYNPDMNAALARIGWPPDPATCPFDAYGKHKCWVCKISFSPLWVRKGVCYDCQKQREIKQICPYRIHVPGTSAASDAKNKMYMCPHQQKCFIDDRVSCLECRLFVLDADEILRVADEMNPTYIFIDWDQTLCTTKSGTKPNLEKHTLREPLLQLVKRRLFWKKHVCILTRNRHKDEIQQFLNHHMNSTAVGNLGDAPSLVPIMVAAAGNRSAKSDVVNGSGSKEGETVLFIDDTFMELVQESSLRNNPNVTRVCFAPLRD